MVKVLGLVVVGCVFIFLENGGCERCGELICLLKEGGNGEVGVLFCGEIVVNKFKWIL